jgi:DNA-damage-inducible protein D
MKDNEMTPFEGKGIRKVWHDEQWFFNVVDVIAILTDSNNPRNYWAQTKKRLAEKEGASESVTNCHRLKFKGTDGKFRLMDAANTEGIFRIIMSVPSPKAEPLKLWLAEQGKRAIDEAENPELLTDRQTELYRAKGYPDEWIAKRVQSIKTRKELTAEWKKRGITENREYGILTAVIAKGTFGLTPSEHGELKGLEKQNLRDHMTNLELIFSALSEEATRQLTEKDDAKGYTESYEVAIKGGQMAGETLKGFEQRTGLTVVSTDNFLHLKGGNKPDELPPEK